MTLPNSPSGRKAPHHTPYFRLAAAETRWRDAHTSPEKTGYMLVCGNFNTRHHGFQAF